MASVREVSQFFDSVRDKTGVGVWAILHNIHYAGKIVMRASKSRANGWNIKMGLAIYGGLVGKDKSLNVMETGGGCGIDLVAWTMQHMMRKNAQEFRDFGIMVPVDDKDPMLKGRDIYEFMFNEWEKVFNNAGYTIVSVL